MSLWGRLFAATYDRCLREVEDAGLRERRRALLREARGRVLELGAGTGANLGLYPAAVTELVLSEPEEPMARRLERRAREASGPPARVVRAPAERLPFADASFDVVVATLVLCTVAEPERVLAEVDRVLVPGGRLLFCEHVRAERPGLARWQRRLTPLQRRLACGCHLDRPTPELVAASTLELVELERGELPRAPAVLRPLATGVARRPAPAAGRS